MEPEAINIEDFINSISEIDPNFEKELKSVEDAYNCKISFVTEKHNSLQYTYYFEVDFGCNDKFYVEVESGINNGTQVNHAEWGISTLSKTKTIEVLKDIILDDSFYEDGSLLKLKAQALLNRSKSKLFDFHRKDDYDNYVTGGNSKMKIDDPLLRQLHLEYVYSEKEVDRIFINKRD